MPSIKKILIVAGNDGAFSPAVHVGHELAQRAEARVHLCMFAFEPAIERAALEVEPEVSRLARKQFIDERLNRLAGVAAGWAEQGIAVDCDVVWAPRPHEALIAKVLETDPALVVADYVAPSTTLFGRSASASRRMLRTCPAPLLLVHPELRQLPRRILAAVDTSMDLGPHPLNSRVLAEALRLALYADAEVHLAHVFPYNPLYAPPTPAAARALREAHRADEEGFRQFAARHQMPAQRCHLERGDAPSTLARLARESRADLLVLGSSYHSTWERLLLGSTCENVVDQAPCSVMVVKRPDFLAELGRHLNLDALGARYRTSLLPAA